MPSALAQAKPIAKQGYCLWNWQYWLYLGTGQDDSQAGLLLYLGYTMQQFYLGPGKGYSQKANNFAMKHEMKALPCAHRL